ncbi:MAG: protein kinase [Treponema sp.]|jgi:serine/threonine protein kinase|nr:protein kinase [Treponema sp.]
METQILANATEVIEEPAKEQNSADVGTSGLLQIGEIVQGYVVQKFLSAQGGEAEIYLCVKDNQNYALKYYYTRSPDPEILEKLFSFSGGHPDIVSYLDSGKHKERSFIILEYAEGGSLDDKKTDGSYKYLPVSEETALQIVKETINAFDICHKNGIIHRDIKPGNLFYKNAGGGDILVGDFGIASIFEADQGMSKHLTRAGGAHTAGYAAPETSSGVIGPEVDYYALGITLWVLLTGEEPFVNEKGEPLNEGQIVLATIQGKTAGLLLSRAPQLGKRMQTLIQGLLTPRHEKRWGHKEVSRFLAGEDVKVFSEAARDLPPFEIAGEKYYDYMSVARALLDHREDGKALVFKGKLVAWLIRFHQEVAENIQEIIETYSAGNRLDEGLVFVAYKLCPSLPFDVGSGKKIASLQDMASLLETDSGAVTPYLRDGKRGLYAYLEAVGLGEFAAKLRELVQAVPEDFKLPLHILVALKDSGIQPSRDTAQDFPPLEIAGQRHNEYSSAARALLAHREEGKTLVFHGKLIAWLIPIDLELAKKILDIIETCGADRQDEGLVFAAYTLCPGLPFDLGNGEKIASLQDMAFLLETAPDTLIPYLRNEKLGLYAYLETAVQAGIAAKVWDVVKAVPGNFRLVSRIAVALKGNVIKPFQDGINNEYELREIDWIYNLPEHLRDRALLFIERRCGDLPAWIENLTGRNLDLWLHALGCLQIKLSAKDKWAYFTRFLQGDTQFLFEQLNENKLWQAINSLKKQSRVKEKNQLVNAAWRPFFDKNDWETARRILWFIKPDNMEGLDESYADYQSCIGHTLAEQNFCEEAIAFYSLAIDMEKKAVYFNGRGNAYRALGMQDKADADYQEAKNYG